MQGGGPGARRVARWLRGLGALAAAMVCAVSLHAAGPPDAAAPLSVLDEPITPIPSYIPANPRRIVLGARLFGDTRLSGDGKRSCSSCHDVTGNGARPRGALVAANKETFDTLTVFNAALNYRLGWEGTFRSLEDKIRVSLENPHMLGGSIPMIMEKLRGDAAIWRLFVLAYGAPPSPESLVDALASYERSLLTPGSRFDRWLGGDREALDAQEMRGYQLFKTMGCVSCHQGVNIGGNLFQKRSIFRPLTPAKPEVLRVPSLRNVAKTAPYFHDGSAPTLEDAVRRMGERQLNATLSEFEIQPLVAFLGTLTGEYRGHPVGEVR